MFAIVGLGNPGQRYANTRHNVGFQVIDELASRSGLTASQWSSKFDCEFVKAQLGGESALLVKPQGFMNLSGETLVPLLRFFKVPPERVIVAYDELDLPCGALRLRCGGSAAGHGGVKDIIDNFTADRFFRVRVGIGRPGSEESKEEVQGHSAAKTGKNQRNQVDSGPRSMSISSWVLGQPRPKEKELLEKAVRSAAEAVEVLILEGLTAAQQKFHRHS